MNSLTFGLMSALRILFQSQAPKYRRLLFPRLVLHSEKVISLWHQTPMGFYQNQVNFAVCLATTGCGVSWCDHLDIDHSLVRSVFRFHVYYQVRRILDELQAPLPQDQVWSPFQNPYERRAYERICREFGVDPETDWSQKDSNSRGLGTVYQYNHGYQPKGSWNQSRMRFQPDSSLSANSSLWAREHVSYISQGPEVDEAWSSFILDNSQGFTAPGVERLNDVNPYLCLGDTGSPGPDTHKYSKLWHSLWCTKPVLGKCRGRHLVPCRHPVGHRVLPERPPACQLQGGLRLRHWPLHGAERHASPHRLHRWVQQRDHDRTSGTASWSLPDINSTPMPAPVETGETGLVEAPTPKHSVSVSQPTPIMAASAPPSNPPEQTRPPWGQAQDHKDEKMALVTTGITLGLVSLWFMRH